MREIPYHEVGPFHPRVDDMVDYYKDQQGQVYREQTPLQVFPIQPFLLKGMNLQNHLYKRQVYHLDSQNSPSQNSPNKSNWDIQNVLTQDLDATNFYVI